MPKKRYDKVPGYVGIYTLPTTQKSRITGKVKPDLSYYARYKIDGKETIKFLGRQSTHKLTPAQASNIRAQLTAGVPVDLPSPRSGKTKPIRAAAGVGDDQADDYVDPESRPPDYWIFDRLWDQYVITKGGEEAWGNYKSDRGIFNNHIKVHVGHLRPADISPFKFQQIRNALTKKHVINAGLLKGLKTAKAKEAEALAAVKKTRAKDKKLKYKARAQKAKAKINEYDRKIRANKRKLSPTTVEHCLELIRRLALFGGENFCPGPPKRLRLKPVDNEKTEDLTPDQIAALLKACDEDPNQDAADMIRLALATGLRRGSLFALTWQHVNFQKKLITIKSIDGGRHSKSGRQIKIPMSSKVKQILKSRAAVADLTFSSYVFPGRYGGRRVYEGKGPRRILRRAGIPDDYRPLYCQRHALASNLANRGVDLYQIGKLLGHSPNSPTLTQRYSHLRDDTLKKASDIMSDIMDRAGAAQDETDDEEKKTG
jgi:integrase